MLTVQSLRDLLHYTAAKQHSPSKFMPAALGVTHRVSSRECGINMELDQVPVHSLVPAALQNIESVADFMQMLPEHDDDMAAQLADAEAHNECLRFVGEPALKALLHEALLSRCLPSTRCCRPRLHIGECLDLCPSKSRFLIVHEVPERLV